MLRKNKTDVVIFVTDRETRDTLVLLLFSPSPKIKTSFVRITRLCHWEKFSESVSGFSRCEWQSRKTYKTEYISFFKFIFFLPLFLCVYVCYIVVTNKMRVRSHNSHAYKIHIPSNFLVSVTFSMVSVY